MKTLIVALSALLSVSSVFASNRATLTEKNGVQTLSLTSNYRPGGTKPEPGVLAELPGILIRAKNVIKVKRQSEATMYYGQYLTGSNACGPGRCVRKLEIEQKIGNRQAITKNGENAYNIFGDAAEEIYAAAVDAGMKPRKSGSKSPDLFVSGDTFMCAKSPLGGTNYRCIVSVNQDL